MEDLSLDHPHEPALMQQGFTPSAETKLQQFATLFRLPDHLVSALETPSHRVQSFGVTAYDERLDSDLDDLIGTALGDTIEARNQLVQGHNALTELAAEAPNRQQRRASISKQARNHVRASGAGSEAHKAWLKNVARKANQGLFETPNIDIIFGHIGLNYNTVFDWEQTNQRDIGLENTDIHLEDVSGLFTPDEIATGVTVRSLARRLRDRGEIDLSEATLNKRFEHFIANCQIATLRFIVDGMHDMVIMIGVSNNLNSTLLTLLNTYEARFPEADLDNMSGMVKEFGETVERSTTGDVRTDPTLRLIAKGADRVRHQLGFFMYGFIQIYRELGYELPAFLQKINDEDVETPPDIDNSPVEKTVEQHVIQDKPKDDTEMEALIADIVADIQKLERPYKYTSEGIRSYKDGTRLVRDLYDELSHKRLGIDEVIAQSLGMLINQSQDDGIDVTEYFVRLLDAHQVIGSLLNDLTEIGAADAYRSTLTDSLKWLDEIVESGLDARIENKQLQQLIYDYCIGPDIQPTIQDIEPEPKAADDEPQGGLLLISESSIAEARRAKLIADRKRAQEVYGHVLSSILETEEIEFVDIVAAATKSGKSAEHRVLQARQNGVGYVDIDAQRLVGLITLRDILRTQGKVAELKFIKAAQYQRFPPFVLHVRQSHDAKGGVCLVENPAIGYSSRIYPIPSGLATSWKRLISMPYQNLEALGVEVQTKIHKPKGAVNFGQHYSLDLPSLINLHLSRT